MAEKQINRKGADYLKPGRALPRFAMHEASVAADLLDIVRQEMDHRGLKHLLGLRITCGRLSCVSAEVLRFNLEAMLSNSSFAGARVAIEEKPALLRCSACGREFSVNSHESLLDPCPACASEAGRKILAGQELRLESIEAE